MQKRKVEDELEARILLAKLAKTGGDLRAFARTHGIDGRSLNAWHHNLARRGRAAPRSKKTGTEAPMRLVELVPTAGAVASARYTVRVGVAEVEVGDDFRADTLARLLEVLRAC